MTIAQDRAIAASLTATRRVTGRSITYVRGVTELSFVAITGVTDWAAQSDYLVTNAWQSRDFIFPLSALAELDPAIPQRGDYIEEVGADGTTRKYELMAPSGAQLYRLMDPGRQWVRVHTKLTSEA